LEQCNVIQSLDLVSIPDFPRSARISQKVHGLKYDCALDFFFIGPIPGSALLSSPLSWDDSAVRCDGSGPVEPAS